MIWLASFPRSGNTFVRNILYEVYGLESSAFHRNREIKLDESYAEFPIVKTHLLPDQLQPEDRSIPAVYIVRDGRDCVVSLAHQRKDMIAPGSDFQRNLMDAIEAGGGSFFGGWSRNVQAWIERADIIIRFEDLIRKPHVVMEKLRYVVDLPRPRVGRMPTFEKLREGQSKYGRGGPKNPDFAKQFYRKGTPGGWKDDMDTTAQERFWQLHGATMTQMGYEKSGDIAPRVRPQAGFHIEEGVLVRTTLFDAGKIEPKPPEHVIANNVGLISVHIPKTAGTSFRNTLRKVYGGRRLIRLDIERKTQILVDQRPFNGKAISEKVFAVHGHFRLAEFRNWFSVRPDAKTITWVRDPVQRVVSNYFYLSDMLAKNLDEDSKGINLLSRMMRSLTEFATAPGNRNLMTRFIKGMKLEEMDFVGVVEHFDEDLEYLSKLLGWTDYTTYQVNTRKLPAHVDPDVIEELKNLNRADVELYEQALALRATRKQL